MCFQQRVQNLRLLFRHLVKRICWKASGLGGAVLCDECTPLPPISEQSSTPWVTLCIKIMVPKLESVIDYIRDVPVRNSQEPQLLVDYPYSLATNLSGYPLYRVGFG